MELLTISQIYWHVFPGSEIEHGKRIKGMWAMWLEEPSVDFPDDTYKADLVGKRDGHMLVTKGYVRKRLRDVWFLTARYNLDKWWPRYDFGSFVRLNKDELQKVLSDTIQAVGV